MLDEEVLNLAKKTFWGYLCCREGIDVSIELAVKENMIWSLLVVAGFGGENDGDCNYPQRVGLSTLEINIDTQNRNTVNELPFSKRSFLVSKQKFWSATLFSPFEFVYEPPRLVESMNHHI